MIFAKNFARNYEKKNTWNIRRMVNESFGPATQRIILKIIIRPKYGAPAKYSPKMKTVQLHSTYSRLHVCVAR